MVVYAALDRRAGAWVAAVGFGASVVVAFVLWARERDVVWLKRAAGGLLLIGAFPLNTLLDSTWPMFISVGLIVGWLLVTVGWSVVSSSSGESTTRGASK
jgi:hypothetical protein